MAEQPDDTGPAPTGPPPGHRPRPKRGAFPVRRSDVDGAAAYRPDQSARDASPPTTDPPEASGTTPGSPES